MAAMLRRAAPTVGGASDAHRLHLGDEAAVGPLIEPDKLDMFWQQQARCCGVELDSLDSSTGLVVGL
jgi:hypothetical protein